MLGVLLKVTKSGDGPLSVEVELDCCSLEDAKKFAISSISLDLVRKEYQIMRERLTFKALAKRKQLEAEGKTKTVTEHYHWVGFDQMEKVGTYDYEVHEEEPEDYVP